MQILVTKNPNEADIITHAGVFHADEAMAIAIYSKACDLNVLRIYRTFSPVVNAPEDVLVIDIGGGSFDHHQKGGNGCRANGVPYASAGLVWRTFGLALVNPEVWEIVDQELIQGIDAMDNGQMPSLNYPAEAFNISRIISQMNPTWDSYEPSDICFLRAVNFSTLVLQNCILNAKAKVKAASIVNKAIEQSENRIMVLDRYVPWQDYIFSSSDPKAKDIAFVVFPSNRGGVNWQCVPDAPNSFGQRKPVPKEWRGLRDGELQVATGVKDAIFCHPAGFIGSAQTLQGAIELALLALES